MLSKKQIKLFQEGIFIWYQKNKRDFPWRRVRDPYHILLSEVMSQQTQINRVIQKYEEWMKTFPTLELLAKAQGAEVLKLWSGLGYNRRAIYLQKTAQIIVHHYNSMFPQEEKLLRMLPGIGPYTARAILCFSFNHQLALVDTNIRKVISIHFFRGIPPSDAIIQDVANDLLPKNKAYLWNQALMDYSSIVLKKEKIPVAQQSSFKASDRYYRGQIIKSLLQKKLIDTVGLLLLFDNTITQERLIKISESLIKDGLMIKDEKGLFRLP